MLAQLFVYFILIPYWSTGVGLAAVLPCCMCVQQGHYILKSQCCRHPCCMVSKGLSQLLPHQDELEWQRDCSPAPDKGCVWVIREHKAWKKRDMQAGQRQKRFMYWEQWIWWGPPLNFIQMRVLQQQQSPRSSCIELRGWLRSGILLCGCISPLGAQSPTLLLERPEKLLGSM